MKLMIKFLVLLSMSFINAFGQPGHLKKTDPKLYLCMGDLGPTVENFIKTNNIQNVKLVGTASIDPSGNMTLNEDLLKSRIVQLFPNPADSGIALIDWEGKAMNLLNSVPPDDANYAAVMSKYMRAIQISKQLRPNVKWSVYGMPFRDYWSMNDAWQKRCLGLAPLLKMCDYIAPSLYNPYADSVSKGNEKKYVHGNIEMALKLGAIVNRPVYALVWHRLPNTKLISKDEFLEHVKRILDESYNGNKIKAIIWYGAETYDYNVKNKVMVAEVGEKNNLTPYVTHLILDYGSGLLKLLNQQN